MKQAVRDHKFLLLTIAGAAILFIAFPLQLQSMEAYSYAAGIERYYNIATTFSLSQGEYLPDFGRYHPNHPLGHVIAGLAFDWLKVPALSWMRFINIVSTLAAAVLVYLLALQIRLSKGAATVAVSIFLTTHSVLFTVYSGEWHMPSLALSLAGTWQVLFFVLRGTKKHLYTGACLLCIAVCYHTAALSYSVCLAVLLVFVRRNHWRELLIAGTTAAFVIILVYFVLPFFALHFVKPSDFLRTFFMYAHLEHPRFGGFSWVLAVMQTLFHGFFFIPATIPIMNWFAIPFFLGISVAAWKFFRSNIEIPVKVFFVFMLFGWPIALAIVGSRANAIVGWISMLPLLCLIVAYALDSLHKRLVFIAVIVPVFLLLWNFYHLVLPNHFYKRENVHLIKLPDNTPKTTPIAFVVNELVLTISEIWYAGSELNYRNQNVFYPCCGEDSYLFRLRRWLRANPGAVVVSDGAPERTERFFRFEKLNYVRWLDRSVSWPASLLPATLYFIRDPGYEYQKRLIVWLPVDKVPLQ
jgi:hypothetical protein